MLPRAFDASFALITMPIQSTIFRSTKFTFDTMAVQIIHPNATFRAVFILTLR